MTLESVFSHGTISLSFRKSSQCHCVAIVTDLEQFASAKSHEPLDYLGEYVALYSDLFCWTKMRRRDERVVQKRHGRIDEMERGKSIPD